LKNYYFLSTSLPGLSLTTPPEITYEDLNKLFDWNLSKKDKKQLEEFKKFIDLKNLRLFLLKKPFDPRGNLSLKEMEEAIEVENFFPRYLTDFLKTHESIEGKLKYFPYLYAKFFQETKEGFNKEYFQFEKELRLVLTALRAKKLDRDLLFELQYEDSKDFFIADMLAQIPHSDYTPPQEYLKVKELFQEHAGDPKTLHEAFVKVRIQWIQHMMENKPFTMDFILGYFAQFLLVEDWHQLDRAKGKSILESIVA
jgi:hypothetical protein